MSRRAHCRAHATAIVLLLVIGGSFPASFGRAQVLAAPASGFGFGAAATARAWRSADAPAIGSHRALRFERVLGQREWYTCGAAAVATWLTFYLGRPTTESEVLQVALGSMLSRGESPSGGLTLRSLQAALAHFGLTARGYRIDTGALMEHFARGGLPVLIHVTRPQLHYVLAVGVVDGRLVLADPAYGEYSVTLFELVHWKGFQGVVLAAELDGERAAAARARQREALAVHAASRTRLARLRDVIAW